MEQRSPGLHGAQSSERAFSRTASSVILRETYPPGQTKGLAAHVLPANPYMLCSNS
jgi:hypothetical protein